VRYYAEQYLLEPSSKSYIKIGEVNKTVILRLLNTFVYMIPTYVKLISISLIRYS
jgi:hypothetical protein